MMEIERISIEPTNRCKKACWFCYNHSQPDAPTHWSGSELVDFVRDCAAHGTKAVSFGGGEPLEFPDLFDVLTALRGTLFRSITSNGLPLLDDETLERLVEARPDKVHLSIHFPERAAEVRRVIEQVHLLEVRGLRSGVNLVVMRSHIEDAAAAGRALRDAGISNERIVYLPMRGQDTPSAEEIGQVAGRVPFQSMTCLSKCAKSPRFASIGWDKSAAWCSYTTTRRALSELTHRGLSEALDGLGLSFCGGQTLVSLA